MEQNTSLVRTITSEIGRHQCRWMFCEMAAIIIIYPPPKHVQWAWTNLCELELIGTSKFEDETDTCKTMYSSLRSAGYSREKHSDEVNLGMLHSNRCAFLYTLV